MIIIALGSNLGDREKNIREGLRLLEEAGVHIRTRSALYRSQPAEGVAGEYFLNAAAVVETRRTPNSLLRLLHQTEKRLGRPYPRKKNEARTIDIDLIYYGRQVIRRTLLQVPHPRRAERPFVLKPAAEIAPEFRDPVLGKTLRELLEKL